jgi:hypothetical protein
MRNGNGKVHTFSPTVPVSFKEVAGLLRGRDPAAGFNRAAEILLDRFQDLKGELGAAPLLKLAIEFHKHSLFCEVAADKTRTQHDAAAYDMFQKYLAGDTDLPAAAGMTQAPTATSPDVDVENGDGESAQDHQ